MAKKTLNFEESMARLEEIVRSLDSGNEGLDESLKLYQEGIALIRACTKRLEDAEQEVKMLSVNAEGKPVLVDFEANGEDNK